MSKAGNAWRRLHGRVTKRPTNFGWVIDSQLAGSGKPMSRAELDWIISQGIDCVITMTEEPLEEQWRGDIDWLHIPTPDLAAPSAEGIEEAVEFIRKKTGASPPRPVAVHCHAGLGRAGTILACYLVKYGGLSAAEAIAEIRGKRPGSIQSKEQETAVSMYERQCRA